MYLTTLDPIGRDFDRVVRRAFGGSALNHGALNHGALHRGAPNHGALAHGVSPITMVPMPESVKISSRMA